MTSRLKLHIGPPITAALDATPDDPASPRINAIVDRYMCIAREGFLRLTFTRREWEALISCCSGVNDLYTLGGLTWSPDGIRHTLLADLSEHAHPDDIDGLRHWASEANVIDIVVLTEMLDRIASQPEADCWRIIETGL